MQVGFESPSVGALCNSGRRLVQTLGNDAATKVKALLFFLDAAPTLADLSKSPPVLRDQMPARPMPLFTVGKAGSGQVLFQPDGYVEGQNLKDIESICVISVGGSV